MDTPEQPTPSRRSSVSAEAIIGSGITIGTLGVLGILLGSAQWMRLQREYAIIFLAIGAGLIAIGAVIAIVGHTRKAR